VARPGGHAQLTRPDLEQLHDVGGRPERVGDGVTTSEWQRGDNRSLGFGDKVRARRDAGTRVELGEPAQGSLIVRLRLSDR
jgi:hypothetical protein